MEVRAALDKLLGEFGAEAGIPNLATEENGVCILVFNGTLNINLIGDPRTGNLMAWSNIGTLPADRAEAALRTLMRANLFWRQTDGGTLGLMPDSEMVVLAMQRPLASLDVPQLQELIESMVLESEQLRAALESPEKTATDTPDDLLHLISTGIRG